MTVENTVKGILDHVVDTAAKAELSYAVCIWKGPFGELNYRVGYFESTTETVFFAQKMNDCYNNKFVLPHIVYSSVASVNNIGNLFEERDGT